MSALKYAHPRSRETDEELTTLLKAPLLDTRVKTAELLSITNGEEKPWIKEPLLSFYIENHEILNAKVQEDDLWSTSSISEHEFRILILLENPKLLQSFFDKLKGEDASLRAKIAALLSHLEAKLPSMIENRELASRLDHYFRSNCNEPIQKVLSEKELQEVMVSLKPGITREIKTHLAPDF
jgi:hypothetical protein